MSVAPETAAPFSESLPGRSVPRRPSSVCWPLAVALGLLRLICLPLVNLHPEKTYYWNYAQHLDLRYLDHLPMVAWLIALSTHLFGHTEFGVRVFASVIFWNGQHRWASFAFQSTGRLREHRRFSLPALLGSVLLMLTPAGVWLAARLWRRRDGAERDNEARRRWLFAWVFTLVPLAVFVLFSQTHRVKLDWTGPLWLALVPIFSAEIVRLADAGGTRASRLAGVATAWVLAVFYLGLLLHLSVGLPGLRIGGNIALLPVGWPLVGLELERQQAALRQRVGGRVLIVGMDKDFIASEAAFYHSERPRSVEEVTGAHLFGSQSLMYAYWFPPAAHEGASLVLASFNEHWLDSPEVRAHCATLEPVQRHGVIRDGQPVCRYYTRVAQGYQSGAAPVA